METEDAWKLPLTKNFDVKCLYALAQENNHPQKLDVAKFQIHKERENVKWNAIEYKKVKVISTLTTDFFF